jgi:hypothetical protein
LYGRPAYKASIETIGDRAERRIWFSDIFRHPMGIRLLGYKGKARRADKRAP